MNIATLEIGCYAECIGGEHYYGYLKGYSDKGFQSIELLHPISKKEAIYLNKKDLNRGITKYKVGHFSYRFETRQEVIDFAIKVWRNYFPDALALKIGSCCVCDPQFILDGPEDFKQKVNKLAQSNELCGGYEGDEKQANKNFHAYQKILKNYEKNLLTPTK